MQHGVDIGEDVLCDDAVVAVMLAELPQPPIGDVADPLAVGRVAVEGEALGSVNKQSKVMEPRQ